jgi:hypothetical protein
MIFSIERLVSIAPCLKYQAMRPDTTARSKSKSTQWMLNRVLEDVLNKIFYRVPQFTANVGFGSFATDQYNADSCHCVHRAVSD